MKTILIALLIIGVSSAMDFTLLLPVDTNGDGKVISNCPMQEVRIIAEDRGDVTGDMILFTFCGLIYDSSFAEMSISGDTISFQPTVLPWAFYCGRDSVNFHIATYFPDSARWFADTLYTGHFIGDNEAPTITEIYPVGALSSAPEHAGFSATDEVCTSLIPHLTMISGSDTLSISDFSIPTDETGDTVWVFASVFDNCADYCEEHFSDTSWFFIVSETIELTYDLKAGWNLVGWSGSEPLDASFFEGIIPPVFRYTESAYVEAMELFGGNGYWLLLPRDILYTVEASEHPMDIPITAGWNLIGGIDNDAHSITDLESVLPPVYEYNPELRSYFETDSLLPFKGYWILATENDTLD